MPARYDDLLAVEISLAEARRASARFAYRILRDGELLATGHTVHACVDLEGRVRRMPPGLLEKLSAGEQIADAGAVSKSRSPV
jgi:acyl-CoA thioester hydrolase